MNHPDLPSSSSPDATPQDERQLGAPSLAEDLLLLLFQPNSGSQGAGTIAGENTLFYILAGAALADLGLGENVRTTSRRFMGTLVEVIEGRPPDDDILRSVWGYVAKKPRGVQTILAAVGPGLREPLLDRLIQRGDIQRSTRRSFGLFDTQVLQGTGGERRENLIAAVRAVLVDGAEPSPRIAALAALISGSGALPQFHQEIPWTSAVVTRAKELEQGNWGAEAAAEAVARTVTAVIVNNVIIAAAVQPKA